MVQKVEVTLLDDLDGSKADEVVLFSLDGKHHEIDLSSTNAKKLRDALVPYVAAARKAGTPQPATRGRAKKESQPALDTAQVREWAKTAGLPVSDRGRIASDVVVKFQAAHS
jgi:Lsr2